LDIDIAIDQRRRRLSVQHADILNIACKFVNIASNLHSVFCS